MSQLSDKLLHKLEALLAKSVENGCTDEEAASAAAMVSRLLQQYNIDEFDLDELLAKKQISEQVTSKTYDFHKEYIKSWQWQCILAEAIAEVTNCKYYLHTTVERFKRKTKKYERTKRSDRQIGFIGTPTNIEVAGFLWHYLLIQVITNCKLCKTQAMLWDKNLGSNWSRDFCEGFSEKVKKRLLDEYRNEIVDTEQSKALVSMFQIVNEEYGKNELGLKTVYTSTRGRNDNAKNLGYAQGDNADIPKFTDTRLTDSNKALPSRGGA